MSEYLVPTALGSMLLTTLFDKRIGYAGTVFLSVLVAGLWGNEFQIMVVSLTVGSVGVNLLHRVSGRRQLIQTSFIMAGVFVFVITLMGFLQYQPMRVILQQWS